MAQAPGRFWVIMHPSSTGDVVAKFDTAGETRIPEEVSDYSDFTVVEVADRSSLANETVDQSVLTQEELDLLSEVYPTDL